MPTITPSPLLMREATFLVAADDYIAAISSAVFTPAASQVTFKGLTPSAVFTAATTATWTCDLTFVQDWSDPDSLAYYLYEHEGDEIEVVFSPEADGTSVTATLIITPGAIGGAVDSYATSTVSLGVVGRPVIEFPGS